MHGEGVSFVFILCVQKVGLTCSIGRVEGFRWMVIDGWSILNVLQNVSLSQLIIIHSVSVLNVAWLLFRTRLCP